MKNGHVTLASVARSQKIDPKSARAKFRRINIPQGYLADKDSWTFHRRAESWIKKQLKTDNRRSA